MQGLWNDSLLPKLPVWLAWTGRPNALFLIGKMAVILFSYIWIRGTIPRYRYDQLMHVGWKWLIPVSLVNLALAALIRYFA